MTGPLASPPQERSTAVKPEAVAASLAPAAVVELFTSEGCISCPRAEEFAEELSAQAARSGLRIFILAYHVDYWNELGHVDRYSASRFTERQRWYAAGWGTTRVYTPQLVVGGMHDVSGNDRRNALLAISEQLDHQLAVGIRLEVERANRVLQVSYEIEPARRLDFLTLALVQDRAGTHVEAGENAGRILRHVNVVRDAVWSRVGSGAGSWTADIPSDLDSGALLAYVQHGRTRRVLGVSRVRIEG